MILYPAMDLMGGRIVQTGGPELAHQLEASGYGSVQAA